jgi:hypothetical protein
MPRPCVSTFPCWSPHNPLPSTADSQRIHRRFLLILQVLCWAPGGVLSAYPSSFLHGKAAASGWAVVNAVGALMGGARFCTPTVNLALFSLQSSNPS